MRNRQSLPILVFTQKIWDLAPHCALTDLALFRGKWFCVFRESNTHAGGNDGIIRLITSSDTVTWKSVQKWEEPGVDLRDPKLSITPEGNLMLLVGGSIYKNGKYRSCQTRVSFSKDAKTWSPLTPILVENDWLWRATWHEGKAYGAAYRMTDPTDRHKEWLLTLYESDDGINYRLVTDLMIPGQPNETTLRFTQRGEMVALVRREMPNHDEAWIGISVPPYVDWRWTPTGRFFGGPNFIILPNGTMWAAGRYTFASPYGGIDNTVVTSLNDLLRGPFLVLPSSGDTSYPGMVLHDDFLWISYYSSHEGKTAVYFAKLKLP